MTTVQAIYDEVCNALLEDGGLRHVYTEAAFLKCLATCLSEFLQATGIVKKIIVVPFKAGVRQYQTPQVGMEVQGAYADNSHLYDNSSFYIDQADPDWRTHEDRPVTWRADQLDANTIEVSPAPSDNGREVEWTSPMHGVIQVTDTPYDLDVGYAAPALGTIGSVGGEVYMEFTGPMFGTIATLVASDSNLAMVATAQPSNTALTLSTVLELIPDSLAPYLVWSILETIWTADGESRDERRAKYARARRIEGINLCKAISGQDLLEKV